MLVLSRKTNEAIQIGQDVRITVVRIQAGVVRLGIEAPKDTPVYREELLNIVDGPELAMPTTPAA